MFPAIRVCEIAECQYSYIHLNKVILDIYFFMKSLKSVRAIPVTQTGEKLKCQIHGIAAHKISEERQSWQGREQARCTAYRVRAGQTRRGGVGVGVEGGEDNKGVHQTRHWHKPWSTFSWGDFRPPQYPLGIVMRAQTLIISECTVNIHDRTVSKQQVRFKSMRMQKTESLSVSRSLSHTHKHTP